METDTIDDDWGSEGMSETIERPPPGPVIGPLSAWRERQAQMRKWFEHWLPALTTGAVGCLLSLAAYQVASEWDFQRRESDFQRDVNLHVDAIQGKLDRILTLVESMGRFFAASKAVSADEFRLFARFSLEQDPELMAIQWLPRVADSNREDFERAARDEGLTGFMISDRVDGRLQPAERRAQYFPILRVEPMPGASPLGFDPSVDPLRALAFSTALETGRPVATPPLPDSSDPSDRQGVEILVPQYRLDEPGARSVSRGAELLGFAVGSVRFGRLVASVVGKLHPEDVDLSVGYRVANQDPVSVYVHRVAGVRDLVDPQSDTAGLVLEKRIRMPGRSFEVTATPAPGYFHASGWPIVVLVIGFVLSLILSLLLQSSWVARNRLREREARLRLFIEHAPASLAIFDRHLRYLAVSQRWLRDYALVGEDVIGRSLYEVLPEIPERWRQLHRRGLAGEVIRSDEDHFDRADGSRQWLRWEVRPWRDAHGEVAGIGIFTEDVTARKEVERELERQQSHLEEAVAARTAELQAAESQMRLILDSSADGIFGTDSRGRVTFVNPSACRMLGYRADDLMGEEMHALIHHSRPDGRPYPAEECPSMMASRERRMVRVDNEVFWGASGGAIPVTYTAHPMMRDGVVTGIVVNFIDMTVQKAAALAREEALAEAERLARVRSDFLANMSHEIRTPLNGVLGLARVGQRQSAGHKIQETFDLILDSGEHLLGVVDDILDFSKIEAGKLVLENQRMELGAVVDRALALVADRAYAKGLDFQVHEASGMPRFCTGDPLRLSQILVNLLSNAIKFTEHGSVRLAVEREGGSLAMHVVDTGIGLSDAELLRLFSPFQQADSSTTRRFGGTGLGLSISRHLVELMNGDIEVESRSGEGSRFTVRVPLVEPIEMEPVPFGRIGLMGLPADESARVVEALSARGLETLMLGKGCDSNGLDLILVCLTDMELGSLAELVERGEHLVVCHRHGDAPLSEDMARRATVLEAPFRVRHLIELLREGEVPEPLVVHATERLQGYSVLAAEDNAVNRLVLAQLLEGEGAGLVCFEDGLAVLEHLDREGDASYQILLMDIQMPRLDGYQAAKRCRERYPDLPVIGLTAHAMIEERRRCFEVGMVEHLPKPVDIDALVEVIKRYARPLAHDPQPRVQVMASTDNGISSRPDSLPAAGAKASPASAEPGESRDEMPLFELAVLESQYRDKPGFVRQLAAILHRTQGDCPTRLRAAASASDWPLLAREAHGIKGMSGNLMAEGLRRLAASTEKAARAESPEASELAERLAQGVEELLRLLPP